MKRVRLVATAAAAGFTSGTLILGIGGRIAMRAVAYADPAPARFTWHGLLVILAAGAVWGAVTGPVLLVFEQRRARLGWATGPLFGAVVLGSAAAVVAAVTVSGGRIVAPPMFVILSAVIFPILFVAHGLFVDALVTRRRVSIRAAPTQVQPSN